MDSGKINWDKFFNEDNLRAGLLDNKYYNATVQSVRHAATDTYRQKLVPSPSDQKILEEEKIKLLFQPHDIDMNESRFGELDFGAVTKT